MRWRCLIHGRPSRAAAASAAQASHQLHMAVELCWTCRFAKETSAFVHASKRAAGRCSCRSEQDLMQRVCSYSGHAMRLQVFAAMERAKGSLKFLDWGVANATLEEVGA